MDRNTAYAWTETRPSPKLCIIASQSGISDFGQNPDQSPIWSEIFTEVKNLDKTGKNL